MDNEDIIELQSQNLYYEMQFADMISDKILEKGIEYWNMDNLKLLHPILARGRISKELANNLVFFKEFQPIIENMDLEAADKVMLRVTEGYKKELPACDKPEGE
jgi:hypothetical protein